MARTMMTAMDGSLISVDLPEIGEIRARAIWSMEDSIGAEFLAPIPPADYRAMLEYLSQDFDAD